MQIKSLLLIFAIGVFLITACNTEKLDADIHRLGYQYYPVQVGDYRIYDVEEINFSFLNGGDTSKYQLKEVIEDYFKQNEDDTSYYLHRYTRDSPEEEWNLDSIWTIRKDVRRLVVVENNVPLIKLVFPLSEGQTWDGNGMNAEEEEVYTITEIGIPFEMEGEKFNETLKVIEKDNMDTVINERYHEAIYAANIGLVYKEQRSIDYCATTVECLGEGIIEGGRKYKQLLKEYGKE